MLFVITETQFRDVSILQSPGQHSSFQHEQHRQHPIEQSRPQQSTRLTGMTLPNCLCYPYMYMD